MKREQVLITYSVINYAMGWWKKKRVAFNIINIYYVTGFGEKKINITFNWLSDYDFNLTFLENFNFLLSNNYFFYFHHFFYFFIIK